jgi:hypothetical protein
LFASDAIKGQERLEDSTVCFLPPGWVRSSNLSDHLVNKIDPGAFVEFVAGSLDRNKHTILRICLASHDATPIAYAAKQFQTACCGLLSKSGSLDLSIAIEKDYDKAHARYLSADPSFDLIMIDYPRVPRLAEVLGLVDLGPHLEALERHLGKRRLMSLFYPSAKQVCVYHGKIVALPVLGNVATCLYNRQTAEREGLEPFEERVDLDVLLHLAETRGESACEVQPIVRGSTPNGIVSAFLNTHFAAPQGDPAGSIEKYVKLARNCSDLRGDPFEVSAMLKLVCKGRRLCIPFGWPGYLAEYVSKEPEVLDTIGICRPLGTQHPMAGYWTLGIPKSESARQRQNTRPAFALMAYLCLFPPTQAQLACSGLPSVLPLSLSEMRATWERQHGFPNWLGPYLSVVRNGSRAPRLRGLFPEFPQVESHLAGYLRRLAKGGGSRPSLPSSIVESVSVLAP